MAFNKVILMGRLTDKPELKQTQGGISVTSFSLAVDRRFNKGEEKQCDFITIVAWKQSAEFICKHFGKGQAMLVCGSLQTRNWTDNQGNKRYATEVVADEVSFVGSKESGDAKNNAPTQPYTPSAYTQNSQNFESFPANAGDEGLPF